MTTTVTWLLTQQNTVMADGNPQTLYNPGEHAQDVHVSVAMRP